MGIRAIRIRGPGPKVWAMAAAAASGVEGSNSAHPGGAPHARLACRWPWFPYVTSCNASERVSPSTQIPSGCVPTGARAHLRITLRTHTSK